MNLSDLRPWEWEAADAEQLDRIREVQAAFREERESWGRHWKKASSDHDAAVAASAKVRGKKRRRRGRCIPAP